MRLSYKEIRAIKASFQECLVEIPFQLFLFGSRIDIKKKGGDIDLLVIVSSENKDKVVNLKSKIRSGIFKYIPEQKIDITVATDAETKSDVFLNSILDSAKLL